MSYRSLFRVFAVVCLVVASAQPAHAQNANALARQGQAAYRSGDYAASARFYEAALEAGGREAAVAYNAACSFALAGDADPAFRYLDVAVELGWADAEHLQRDGDLASLHADPRWGEVVRRTEAKARQEQLRWAGTAFETPYREDLPAAEKVAGLSRLWAEAKFNFANFDLVPALDWDSLYLATLPRVTATTSTLDYYRVLTEMVAHLQDGHCNVYPPRVLADQVYARPALRTRKLGDVVAVVAVYDDALRADGIEPGLELVAIDGTPVEAYAAEHVRPYQSASTRQDLDARTYEYRLLAGPAGPLALTFRRADGTTFDRTVQRLTREASEAAGVQARAARPAFHLEMLPGNVAYVALNSFGTDEAAVQFMEAFDEIARADGIVFDVRENGGGNSSVGWAILATLTDAPFATSNWRTLEYRPAYRAWGHGTRSFGQSGNTYAADSARHYTGPVAVLTSPRTYSAAEDFAVAFDAMDRGTLVGQPTGGSTGQPLFFTLPGGGSARITTKRDTYPDGRDFVGTGVRPDVAVAPTLEDLRRGRDPELQAALDALRGGRNQPGAAPSGDGR